MARACSRTLVVACAIALCCGARGLAQADRAKAEALARRATARIRALHAEAERLAREERTILNELRQLEIDRRLKAEEAARLDAELIAARSELATTTAQAAELEQQVIASEPAVAARLASLYKMGRPGYWRLLLDVEDVRGIGRAYRSVAAMARLDRERIEEHQRSLVSLRAARDAARRRAGEVQQLQAGAAAARAALDRAIVARTRRVATIDEQRDLNAQLAGELQDAQRKLQASLAGLGSVRAGSVTLPLAPFRGALPWPVRGRVTARFGRQTSSRFGTSIVRNGVEIAAPEGDAVNAIHEGQVAFAGPFTGFGNLVIVTHGGEQGREHYSLYGHLDGISVERGETVQRQSQVGTVGRTPTGQPAVYFELRVDGRPVDPLQWLER